MATPASFQTSSQCDMHALPQFNNRQKWLELFLPSVMSELSGNSSQFQNLFTLHFASSFVILGNSSWSCFFPAKMSELSGNSSQFQV
jgi:hypothetical protein